MAYADSGIVHVLVIDDEPHICDLIAQVLIPDGHQVVTARSAEKGLEQLPFYTFDVAFLDHHLPGMEGLVFGEYLRKNNPFMQIALVTGDPDERLRRHGRAHGITVIDKPFDVADILDVVGRAQRSHAERRARLTAEAEPAWAPAVSAHWEALPAYFRVPGVPHRIEEILTTRIRDALTALRRAGSDGEEHRVAAFAGLVAAQVLGLKLPRGKDGRTLFEDYDALMVSRSRRPEFSRAPAADGSEPG